MSLKCVRNFHRQDHLLYSAMIAPCYQETARLYNRRVQGRTGPGGRGGVPSQTLLSQSDTGRVSAVQ